MCRRLGVDKYLVADLSPEEGEFLMQHWVRNTPGAGMLYLLCGGDIKEMLNTEPSDMYVASLLRKEGQVYGAMRRLGLEDSGMPIHETAFGNAMNHFRYQLLRLGGKETPPLTVGHMLLARYEGYAPFTA